MPTLYRWKVLKDDAPLSPWKMVGKVLKYRMSEEDARQHEANGAK